MRRFMGLIGGLGYFSCCAVLAFLVFVPFLFSEVEHRSPGIGYVSGAIAFVGLVTWKYGGNDIEAFLKQGSSSRAIIVFCLAALSLFILGLSSGLFGGIDSPRWQRVFSGNLWYLFK